MRRAPHLRSPTERSEGDEGAAHVRLQPAKQVSEQMLSAVIKRHRIKSDGWRTANTPTAWSFIDEVQVIK